MTNSIAVAAMHVFLRSNDHTLVGAGLSCACSSATCSFSDAISASLGEKDAEIAYPQWYGAPQWYTFSFSDAISESFSDSSCSTPSRSSLDREFEPRGGLEPECWSSTMAVVSVPSVEEKWRHA